MRKIELLAPARTADIGIEAFRHGADAVYIGAPAFGARSAASNTVEDIERLAAFGHQYGAKTIIALNTILTDAELVKAERLAWQLYEAGADALIVQDLGLLEMKLPPIELHASTQTDNRTVEKVRLLHDLGMTRVVMARELSVEQIAAIHEAVPTVELECFVHGALCVSVSGNCYMSAALTGRSANRGACAQPCRLPMDLTTPDGSQLLARQQHLLSLCDMNRSAFIEQLIDAGVTSLKIEGRLKDIGYVKNVVAYYRQLLDKIYERRPEDYHPVSQGHAVYTFTPNLNKSFNRGFTSYFAEGKREPMWNFESPKSVGEKVGRIVKVERDSFQLQIEHLQPNDTLHNGDGLAVGGLGFRLNRFDGQTGRCYPLDGQKVCQQLRKGQLVYRNLDTAFEQQLSKSSAKRTIPVDMAYVASDKAIELTMRLATGVVAKVRQDEDMQHAERDQADNIRRQLSKLGGTILEPHNLVIEGSEWFVPSSKLAELRRMCTDKLLEEQLKVQSLHRKSLVSVDYVKQAEKVLAKGILPENYEANIMNQKGHDIMRLMGVENVDDAFETQHDKEGMVMQTKHCLKYAFGQCPKYANPQPAKLLDPAYKIGNEMGLRIGNRKFILKFGCKNDCFSKIFTIFAPSLNKSTK